MSHGTEEHCPKSPNGGHEPDWASAHIEEDGGERYVDVNCKHCGRSGCVGKLSTLQDDLCW